MDPRTKLAIDVCAAIAEERADGWRGVRTVSAHDLSNEGMALAAEIREQAPARILAALEAEVAGTEKASCDRCGEGAAEVALGSVLRWCHGCFASAQAEAEKVHDTTPPTPTLRDQFAMAALNGSLANHETTGTDADLARWAYERADAMLTARESRAPQTAGDGGTQKELADADRAASDLAMALWRKHYASASPHFALCNTVPGIIAQIDNMASGLTLDQSTRIRELKEALRAWVNPNGRCDQGSLCTCETHRLTALALREPFPHPEVAAEARAARVLGDVQP